MVYSIVLAIIGLLCCSKASAQQTGQLYLNPTSPQYSHTDNTQINLLDTPLQNELAQFSQRRANVQEVQFVDSSDSGNVVQSDSFVFRRIMDRTLTRLTKSDYFKKTSVGRGAESVKKNMETSAEFGSANQTKHKFDFKLAGFQGQAFIQYTGFTKAQVRYDVKNGGSIALIYKKDLSPTNFIGFENTFTGDHPGQYMTLNFIW